MVGPTNPNTNHHHPKKPAITTRSSAKSSSSAHLPRKLQRRTNECVCMWLGFCVRVFALWFDSILFAFVWPRFVSVELNRRSLTPRNVQYMRTSDVPHKITGKCSWIIHLIYQWCDWMWLCIQSILILSKTVCFYSHILSNYNVQVSANRNAYKHIRSQSLIDYDGLLHFPFKRFAGSFVPQRPAKFRFGANLRVQDQNRTINRWATRTITAHKRMSIMNAEHYASKQTMHTHARKPETVSLWVEFSRRYHEHYLLRTHNIHVLGIVFRIQSMGVGLCVSESPAEWWCCEKPSWHTNTQRTQTQ